MIIGVLSMQGDIREHIKMLDACGVEAVRVKTGETLTNVDGLIIPGGESTTIIRLLNSSGLRSLLIRRANEGLPVWGTCAGMIVVAKSPINNRDRGLGLIDIQVKRNAFGRQVDSFEVDIPLDVIGKPPYRCIFIRAPVISNAGKNVELLAQHNGFAVMGKERNVLVTSFHPELTNDKRIHKYFINMVKKYIESHEKLNT
ncbi:MAG: pyridoxal 5'-phosphate synthase glutaminase subunit PdxT [Thermotogae bacterium]|nr:pyridoxal 5'-phosphate synthase glutaminase subunit PdxT [Thermotogota bacterium]